MSGSKKIERREKKVSHVKDNMLNNKWCRVKKTRTDNNGKLGLTGMWAEGGDIEARCHAAAL